MKLSKDHVAKFIQNFSEFGFPYHTMVLPPEDAEEDMETQAKEGNKSSNSTEAKDNHANKAKSPDAANEVKKSTDIGLVKILRKMKIQEKWTIP